MKLQNWVQRWCKRIMRASNGVLQPVKPANNNLDQIGHYDMDGASYDGQSLYFGAAKMPVSSGKDNQQATTHT